MLIPQDLQTHVSQGASIHSLLYNGMNKCVIQPITSEAIMVITKDEFNKILVPPGTQIPSDVVIINDLVTTRDHQETIELPICIGSPRKLLYNLCIKSNTSSGFPLNAPVKIALEINADKLLLVEAECMGNKCTIEPQNPFANKELTTEERIVLAAERQANLEAEANDGNPTKRSLMELRNAYMKAGKNFRAAETLELQTELYPDDSKFNEIGLLYSSAGNNEKAIEFYERSWHNDQNSATYNFNLGYSLRNKNRNKYEKLIRKAHELSSEHGPSLVELSRIEKEHGNYEKAKELMQRAYDMYYKQWSTNSLAGSGVSWFAFVAEELGHKELAYQARHSCDKESNDNYYQDDNLTKMRSNLIE